MIADNNTENYYTYVKTTFTFCLKKAFYIYVICNKSIIFAKILAIVGHTIWSH